MSPGRILPNIYEIEIERDEDAIFAGGRSENRWIVFSLQSLSNHVVNIVPFCPQHASQVRRHVLVELESHTVTSVWSGCSSSS